MMSPFTHGNLTRWGPTYYGDSYISGYTRRVDRVYDNWAE